MYMVRTTLPYQIIHTVASIDVWSFIFFFIFQTPNSLCFPISNLQILLFSSSKVSLFTFHSPTSDQDLNQGPIHSDEDHNPSSWLKNSTPSLSMRTSFPGWLRIHSKPGVTRPSLTHTQLTSHPRLAFTCPTLLVSDCDLHQLEPFARAPMC